MFNLVMLLKYHNLVVHSDLLIELPKTHYDSDSSTKSTSTGVQLYVQLLKFLQITLKT
jgi:hypothetical protein